jgi:Ion channel
VPDDRPQAEGSGDANDARSGEAEGARPDEANDARSVETSASRRSGSGRPRRPRLRESRNERYFFLLGLLVVDICVIGLAGAGRWATFSYTPITAATLLLALRTSEARRRTLRIAWVAAGIAVVGSLLVAFTGSKHLNGYVYFMLFALLVISPVAIARRIVMSRRVTLRLLVAAICVYLMIGLLFTFMYLGINGVHPSFFAQGPQKDPSIYLYFSFITMTTVGFGDFTPGSSLPRVLVVFEAMLGQVFLVTAVARLVSLYSSESPEPGDVVRDGEDGG